MVGRRFFSLVGAISDLRASGVWKHLPPADVHAPTTCTALLKHGNILLSIFWIETGASCCWSLADVRLCLTMDAVRLARLKCHFHSSLIVPIVAHSNPVLSLFSIDAFFLLFTSFDITNFFCWLFS
jgi:hypothetical protein